MNKLETILFLKQKMTTPITVCECALESAASFIQTDYDQVKYLVNTDDDFSDNQEAQTFLYHAEETLNLLYRARMINEIIKKYKGE